MNNDLLVVEHLIKYFSYKKKYLDKKEWVHAVDDISFSIPKGATFGVVGESGCGKTTIGRLLMRLIEPTSGSIYFEGQDLLALNFAQTRQIRKDIQIVFQDPYGSLDPNMRIRDILSEPFIVHGSLKKNEYFERIDNLLELVGLDPANSCNRFPHEFSGGQRQRICIARSIALQPHFLIFDEAVSSLDVSVQSQILNLISKIQKQYNLTYLFISHNLSVINHICDSVAVMYLGKIVEIADSDELFSKCLHPYTQALMKAIPEINNVAPKQKRAILRDDLPNPINLPSGCRFHPRCLYQTEICAKQEPELQELFPKHRVACHHPLMALKGE